MELVVAAGSDDFHHRGESQASQGARARPGLTSLRRHRHAIQESGAAKKICGDACQRRNLRGDIRGMEPRNRFREASRARPPQAAKEDRSGKEETGCVVRVQEKTIAKIGSKAKQITRTIKRN